jgi:protein-tyrosine kinase
MSNIYEALIQAEQEKRSGERVIPVDEEQPAPARVRTRRAARQAVLAADRELLDLYQNIVGLLPGTPGTTIQFIGSRESEGVSTIVREFARAAALRFDRRVLIMDAAHQHPTQHLHFAIKSVFGWRDALATGTPLLKGCYPSSDKNLFVSPISSTPVLTSHLYDEEASALLFSELRDHFELIVIDSSPATTSSDSVALTRLVDGVILVLEAEKTRRQVVENVKNRIIKNGGNILGVIYNKRRFYIPERIYARL